MGMSDYWLQHSEIPDGYQIYENCIDIAGERYRRRECQNFMKSKISGIALHREPLNPHDENAIAVIGMATGLFRTKKFMLGYIPREVAEYIVANGFWGKILPRLYNTYLGDTGWVNVKIQLLGPRGEKNSLSDSKQWRFSDKYRGA
jgi:hypothetical protein